MVEGRRKVRKMGLQKLQGYEGLGSRIQDADSEDFQEAEAEKSGSRLSIDGYRGIEGEIADGTAVFPARGSGLRLRLYLV
jgi:hypothetical protein